MNKVPIRLAIVGSRGFNDYPLLCSTLATLDAAFDITEVVSGGARGADSLGERWAKEKGIKCTIFFAEWDKYGKSAGIRRNHDIIGNADFVVAFWDGQSHGTAHSIQLARDAGRTVIICNF